MRRNRRGIGLTAAVVAAAAGGVAGAAWAQDVPAAPTQQPVVGHRAEHSPQRASLVFELPGGETLTIAVQDGTILLNGAPITAGGDEGLAQRLREVIERAARLETSEVVASVKDLEPTADADALAVALAKLAVADAVFSDVAAEEAVDVAPRRTTRLAPPPRQAVAERTAASSASAVGGVVGGLMNLVAVYVALAFMGLGILFFAPRQLEVIADTVWHSFWRSFLAGLFAQPLILPVFGMLIVGLTLTVVGIVVVPFAIVGFLVALVLAVVGGFVAVARTLGEIYLRRKMARGERVATWGSYRYVVYGLLGLLSVWLPTILLGPVPVAGDLLLAVSTFITWMIGTAGFGAALLSRGGVRATFVRRLDLALTDEQYWSAEGMPTQQPASRVRRR